MDTLRVELGSRSYPILIGQGLLQERALFEQYVRAPDLLVVTNTVVAPLYLAALESSLGPRRVVVTVLPDGEPQKTLANVARILDVLVANRFGRDCAVVALGGGVAGDMAGFAAATYQRGVAFVQVPTTLLAQVDSSVGGKTGVNHPGGKNLIGAFHQPIAVVADTRTLATLPPRELRAGLAEVIKYGLICDAGFFAWLEAHIDELLAADPAALAYVVRRSCEIKAEIVGRDEREQGDRPAEPRAHLWARRGIGDGLRGMAAWRGDRRGAGDVRLHVTGVRVPHCGRARAGDAPDRPRGVADARFECHAPRRTGAHAHG
jgi:3-dehydroquinate synthase